MTTGLSLCLIPRLQLVGAALAVLVGQAATQNWVTPAYAFRLLRMRFGDDLRDVIGPVVVAGGAATLVGMAVYALPLPPSVGLALAACVLAGMTLAGLKPYASLVKSALSRRGPAGSP